MTDSFRRRLSPLAALLLVALGAAGCAINPATGRQQLALISPQQEAAIGAQEFPRMVEQFDGVYPDTRLAAYVERIGRSVAVTTETPGAPFRFAVLNSELPNAFALPGGYVSVTRGLLALANDEAELAGVLAHEVAHVTARHSAERYSQSTLAQLGIGVLGAATGSQELAQAVGAGAQLYLLSYSRDQESEADTIGIRYMTNAGYDPQAMSSFLAQLDRSERLDGLIDGGSTGGTVPGYLRSHPRTADRVRQAAAVAAQAAGRSSRRNRDAYFDMIDGMVWGESGNNGFVRGTTLAHPNLGFLWRAPDGFSLEHSGERVIGSGPGEARIIFDTAAPQRRGPAIAYLTDEWARNRTLAGLERIDVNGFEAATGTFQAPTDAGTRDIRVVAIRLAADRFARFIFLTPPQRTAQMAPALQRTTFSFRPMTRSESQAYGPLRIDVVPVRRGDTVTSLARRMAFDGHQVERFLALNGLDRGAALQAGERVKLIVE
ncbi:MAG: M48 family metalloprotease [Inquilinus sp.]|nr:M48 family metalloprotease [Inquilinus sp.]